MPQEPGRFRVVVRLPVVARDARGSLRRDVELPFAPYPGLSLDGICPLEEGVLIERVNWHVGEGRFEAFLEQSYRPDMPLADTLDCYGEGWRFEPEEIPGSQLRDVHRPESGVREGWRLRPCQVRLVRRPEITLAPLGLDRRTASGWP
jgi:hypothetical protein